MLNAFKLWFIVINYCMDGGFLMIITFCGHSNCLFSDDVKEQLKNSLVNEIIKNPTCKFYLGGYGDFDGLCLHTLKNLKANFPEIELIFITPYLDN